MSENVKLGELLTAEAQRDAVHVAIAPVVANERLFPGAHIGLVKDSTTLATAIAAQAIGVVDPFLTAPVEKGGRFYMVLYPNTVTGMRHHWQHPAFVETSVETAEKWLRAYVMRVCPYDAENGEDAAYQSFMSYVRSGEIFYHGSDLHGLYELEQAEELFANLSIVLGRPVCSGDFEYTCSC